MTTAEIQDEIERTRDELATTLSAIERKLSPRQIMDQAVDTMRELASDQSRVGSVVRDNPIPLALIGLGIGWLAVSGAMSRRSSAEGIEGAGWSSGEGAATYGYAPGAEPSGYGTAGSAEYVAGTATSSTGGGLGLSGGGDGQGVRERASQLTGQAGEKLAQATSGARARVDQWSRSARSSASQAVDRTWDAYQQHPLTMGFVAALVGAALGALVPTSRREQQMMSGTAEEIVNRAREAGSEVMDKAARVADRAVQAAKDETRQSFREESPSSTGPASTMTH